MRYIASHILDDLRKKMFFVGGPRQVGKTTLAKGILSKNFPAGIYLNWDYKRIDRIFCKRDGAMRMTYSYLMNYINSHDGSHGLRASMMYHMKYILFS